jgi:hypothetical protein
MNDLIVKELADWLEKNRAYLALNNIEIDERFPKPLSNFAWKASIGLTKDNIFVSFTVWERTAYQTELIVIDGELKKDLLFQDLEPKRPEEIVLTLDTAVISLINGTYINR